jgi:hypothetical protein
LLACSFQDPLIRESYLRDAFVSEEKSTFDISPCQILVFQLVLRPVRKFLLLLCDIVLYSVDEVNAKLDVEAANGHRIDEELWREVPTSILMCYCISNVVSIYLS